MAIQGSAKIQTKFESDLKSKINLTWFMYASITLGVYSFANNQTDSSSAVLFQEYHKSVIGLAAIFFAFSPTFYALIYSSEAIRSSMIESGLKKYFDEYFKLSTIFSALLVITSVVGLILSYSSLELSNGSKIKSAAFALAVAAMACAFYWSFNYGKIAFNMIKFYTSKLD